MKDSNYRWRFIEDDDGLEIDDDGEYWKCICPHCEHKAYYDNDMCEYVLFPYCPYCGKKLIKE
jgi:NAD-dependent SIR2 family protein deacetylase